MRIVVIYHANCWDGFCAAWLFSKAYPDAEFIPAHYGTEPPDVTGALVAIVDFSYKRDVMLQIIAQAMQVVVLDHHKTAQEELTGLIADLSGKCELGVAHPIIQFDMNKSGGRLAWEFLYGQKLLPDDWLATNKSGYSLGVAPWLVDYTEDRDMWWHKLTGSREINASLRSYPLDFKLWDDMREAKPCERLYLEGAAILRREQQIIQDHLRHVRDVRIDEYSVPCVNATVLFSEIAGELAKGRPFGACYFDRQDGKCQFSLRSDENGIDVSEVAKRFGGGGHKHAAGFETDQKIH